MSITTTRLEKFAEYFAIFAIIVLSVGIVIQSFLIQQDIISLVHSLAG
jgi:hypothetical protein